MLLFGDVQGLNFGNLLPTNIAVFLDPKDVSRTVYAILESLDLVQLWYFALLGIGLSVDSDDPASPPGMLSSNQGLRNDVGAYTPRFANQELVPGLRQPASNYPVIPEAKQVGGVSRTFRHQYE